MIISKIKKISEHIELHVFDLVDLTPEIIDQIDANIVEICEGHSGTDIGLVKSIFLNFLQSKDYKSQIGSVAEFFVHLYLRQSGFKQEFLFFNLEEGALKKGFDGLFSHENEKYLVESKSGLDSTTGISHKRKLKEAYDDISSVISGDGKKSKNNPWKNAYNHASHIDVNTEKSIRKKIKNLSDGFDKGNFNKIEEFNVVPCSSIFITKDWNDEISGQIFLVENSFFENFKSKSVKAVCVTKATYKSFFEYLGAK